MAETLIKDCPDADVCDGQDTCVAGTCQTGAAPNCNDGVGCTDDSCNEGTDSCDTIPNNASCNDSNICTDDSCDEANDVVVNSPNNSNIKQIPLHSAALSANILDILYSRLYRLNNCFQRSPL